MEEEKFKFSAISKLKIKAGEEEYISGLKEKWVKLIKRAEEHNPKNLTRKRRHREEPDEYPSVERQRQLRKEHMDRAIKAVSIKKNKMIEYHKTEDLKYFARDVRSYSYIYVFCFAFAKLHSDEYWKFIKSFSREDDKVYFGPDRISLAKLIAPREDEKNPNSRRGELKPGLLEIANVLENQGDVGLLLTHKKEPEVFRKFKEYFELDYLEPLDAPWSTLVFEEGEVLSLPPNSSADSMFPELQELGMPVELSDGVLKLTKIKAVCQVTKAVTEKNSNILKLLERKMRPSFITLRCHWIASTGKTHYYSFSENVSNGSLPGEPDFKWD